MGARAVHPPVPTGGLRVPPQEGNTIMGHLIPGKARNPPFPKSNMTTEKFWINIDQNVHRKLDSVSYSNVLERRRLLRARTMVARGDWVRRVPCLRPTRCFQPVRIRPAGLYWQAVGFFYQILPVCRLPMFCVLTRPGPGATLKYLLDQKATDFYNL